MATLQKKRSDEVYDPERIYASPDIVTYFELEIDGNILKPGDKVLLKGDTRTQWKFRCLAHNIVKDSTWVDLISDMGFRAVRIDQIKLIKVVKKRSRRHKPNGV